MYIFKWPLKTGFTICTLYKFQVKTDLETELLINKIQLGWLDTAFLLPYALMQVFISMTQNKKNIQIRPNKKISVFRVTSLKILGRVGTHIFVLLFNFLEKKT